MQRERNFREIMNTNLSAYKAELSKKSEDLREERAKLDMRKDAIAKSSFKEKKHSYLTESKTGALQNLESEDAALNRQKSEIKNIEDSRDNVLRATYTPPTPYQSVASMSLRLNAIKNLNTLENRLKDFDIDHKPDGLELKDLPPYSPIVTSLIDLVTQLKKIKPASLETGGLVAVDPLILLSQAFFVQAIDTACQQELLARKQLESEDKSPHYEAAIARLTSQNKNHCAAIIQLLSQYIQVEGPMSC